MHYAGIYNRALLSGGNSGTTTWGPYSIPTWGAPDLLYYKDDQLLAFPGRQTDYLPGPDRFCGGLMTLQWVTNVYRFQQALHFDGFSTDLDTSNAVLFKLRPICSRSTCG